MARGNHFPPPGRSACYDRSRSFRTRPALQREAKWLPRTILRCATAPATPRQWRRGAPAGAVALRLRRGTP
jgi:hypothetical protein